MASEATLRNGECDQTRMRLIRGVSIECVSVALSANQRGGLRPGSVLPTMKMPQPWLEGSAAIEADIHHGGDAAFVKTTWNSNR